MTVSLSPSYSSGQVTPEIIKEASLLREKGEFNKSSLMLQSWLDQNTTTVDAQQRRTVEYEIERLKRIRRDYRLTREQLLANFRDELTTMTDEQFDAYERDGNFDIQWIDGQKWYANTSVSNLIFRHWELRKLRKKPVPSSSQRRLYQQKQWADAAHKATGATLVCPQDFLVTHTITVPPESTPEGKLIRAWLPYVHMSPQQTDAVILNAEPAIAAIAPPEYPHRTVYMEQTAKKDQPATFTLTFVYRSWIRANYPEASKVRPYDKESSVYKYYTAERKPHIDFSHEELKRIQNEIQNSDPNPLLRAKAIYDWVAKNTIYQYANEYCTIDNISAYTAGRRAGDCGQHGMLFIALCRLNGIPARWATGWQSYADRGYNMHDWVEFYVEPYGWLPADPDAAGGLTHYYEDQLTKAQAEELREWLFGNMDHFRLTTNTDHGFALYPEKTDFRSDTVDFQRGEVEVDGKNLYYGTWSWKMNIKPIAAEEAEKLRAATVPPKPELPPAPTPVPIPTPTPTPAPTPVVTPAPQETTATQATETVSTATQDAVTTVSQQ